MTLLTPEYLQTKGYSAQRDRYAIGAGLTEGIDTPTSFAVSQRGAGANMSVDVAAGRCWVQGDSIARQGLYQVVNDATVNATVSAADGSNPRIDRVVVQIEDSTDIPGDVSDTPTITVIAGTPTGGATLSNLNGAAAVPSNALLLANVLVPAGSSSVTTANIGDKRPKRSGVVSIATEESTTSTSFTTLATPDQVSNVVMPTNGLMFVAYEALWKRSANTVQAAIFLSGNQLGGRTSAGGAPTLPQVSMASVDANEYTTLISTYQGPGLTSPNASGGTTMTSPASTGQLLYDGSSDEGGVAVITAAAGTYDISIRFLAVSGTVTAKERKLWVWTQDFNNNMSQGR